MRFSRTRAPVFISALALVAVGGPAGAAGAAGTGNWPGFLGPAANGKSAETGVFEPWSSDGPPLLWHVPVGEGYAAPSTAGGRLFLFDRHDDRLRLTAMRPATGEELWRAEYETDYEDMYGYSNGPRAAPVVDGDRVYTFGPGGRLRCHRVETGNLLWDVDTASTYGVVQNFFGAGSVPVIEGDLLIAAIGGSPPGTPGIQSGRVVGNGTGLVAFDKGSGEERYRATDELASYSSPVLATIAGRSWGFWFARGGLVGFEPATGKVDFTFPFRARKLESVNAANPVVVGDTVFITESYEPGSAVVRVRPGGYQVLRRDPGRRDQSLSSHFMTPIHDGGVLYGSHGQGSSEAELRAIDYVTGEVLWSQPGLGRATLLWVDGRLVVYTERGRLLLVEATAERFSLLADATPRLPANSSDDNVAIAIAAAGEARTEDPGLADSRSAASDPPQLLRYPAWSPPMLSRGILYLRGKGRLAAFQLLDSSR